MVRGPGPLCRDGRDPQELELIKQMGYRLRLETADLPTAASHGSEIGVTIKMADDDSGSLFNPRGVELILRSVQPPTAVPGKQVPATTGFSPRWRSADSELAIKGQTTSVRPRPVADTN